jgi:hypothetical protein
MSGVRAGVGDQLARVALPVATYVETRSALAVGVVAAAGALAGLAGTVAGRRVGAGDRARPARAAGAGAAALAALGGALLLAVPAVPALPVLLAVAAVLGATRARRDDVPGASPPAAAVAGPVVAGILLAVVGPVLTLIAVAATFAVARLGQPALALDRSEADPGAGAALRVLLADGPTARALVLAAATGAVGVAAEAQFVPYAGEVLAIGNLALGAYLALGSLAFAVTARRAARRPPGSAGTGLTLVAAGVLVAGLLPSRPTAAMAQVAVGAGGALVAAHVRTLRRRRLPPGVQASASAAIRVLLLAALPVPLVVGGALASAAGPPTLFAASGAVGLGFALWAAAYSREVPTASSSSKVRSATTLQS